MHFKRGFGPKMQQKANMGMQNLCSVAVKGGYYLKILAVSFGKIAKITCFFRKTSV